MGYNPWGRKESDMTEVTEDAHRVCIYQLGSVAQLGTTLCNPMDCSPPWGLLSFYELDMTEVTQHYKGFNSETTKWKKCIAQV